MTDLKSKISAYIDLCKPRIGLLVLVTTALGYYLGAGGFKDLVRLFMTLLGTAVLCSGAAVLNHYLERDSDALMNRTRRRPLPMGIIAPQDAMIFGVLLTLFGVLFLSVKINLLTSFLGMLTAFLYVLVYTPMKKISWLNTTVGAIPGAIPPMGGWAAATGEISAGAWVLFLLMFIWQHPHFYSIAWLCREDYQKAGFKMLSFEDANGRKLFRHTFAYTLALIPVSVLPAMIGMSGPAYFWGALTCGLGLLYFTYKFQSGSIQTAHHLLKASVVYFPLILTLIVIDRWL